MDRGACQLVSLELHESLLQVFGSWQHEKNVTTLMDIAIVHTDQADSDGTIILTFDSCTSGAVIYDIPSINR